MKRFSIAAAGVLCSAGVALIARDAAAQTFGYNDRRPNESRQDWAIELYAGGYVPAIDNEFGGQAQPYHDVFGTTLQPLAGVNIEWETVRLGPVGSLGVSLGVGYSTMAAQAPFTAYANSSTDPMTWQLSQEKTGINIVPVKFELVLRVDGLARRVPYAVLVPYARLGLAYSFWWVTIGSGNAHDTQTTTGTDGMQHVTTRDAAGGSLGWTTALGLMILLDPFEARLAREFDASDGVNHTYLFVEGYYTDLHGFGTRPQLNVGTQWDFTKTALAFNIGLTFEY